MRNFENIENRQLIEELVTLVKSEHDLVSGMVEYLAEIEVRKTYVPMGFSSLYDYCHKGLGLSRNKSFNRSKAARSIQFFPGLLPLLKNGDLSESVIGMISPKLTHANYDKVIKNVRGKSKRKAEMFMSTIDGNGDSIERKPKVELRFKCSEELLEKIERAKELVGAKRGGDSLASALDAALDSFLEAKDPMKIAARALDRKNRKKRELAPEHSGGASSFPKRATEVEPLKESPQEKPIPASPQPTLPGKSPRGKSLNDILGIKHQNGDTLRKGVPKKQKVAEPSRYIPFSVKHEVMMRDGGQCTFVGDSGRRCEERSALEFDHIQPFALGGTHSVVNLRLRCHSHNLHAAEVVFGRDFMKRKMEKVIPSVST